MSCDFRCPLPVPTIYIPLGISRVAKTVALSGTQQGARERKRERGGERKIRRSVESINRPSFSLGLSSEPIGRIPFNTGATPTTQGPEEDARVSYYLPNVSGRTLAKGDSREENGDAPFSRSDTRRR